MRIWPRKRANRAVCIATETCIVPILIAKCGRPHFAIYVASTVMWRGRISSFLADHLVIFYAT
jgi:hypothetical protein